MRHAIGVSLLSLGMLACGGGDEGDGSGAEPSCSMGGTLSGDVQASFNVGNDIGCAVIHSGTSGIQVVYIPLRAITSLSLLIGEVTEGETGGPFPTGVEIAAEDDRRYSTASGSCSTMVTEHAFESAEQTEMGEQRSYRVAGTTTCNGPAVTTAGTGGEITIGELAFRTSAVWTQ